MESLTCKKRDHSFFMGLVIILILATTLTNNLILGKECTLDDYGSTYSSCDYINNPNGMRTVIYYKKDNCSEGNVPIPSSNTQIPCNLTCPNGEFLSPPSLVCQKCKPGEFSFSEGVRIDEWKTLPETFKTTCTSDAGEKVDCEAWKVATNGKYIYSGDQPKLTQIATSTLTYFVNILRESGSIEFSFRADSGPEDGLEFYIDDRQVLGRVSYVATESIKTFPLTKGYHRLEWRYIKESTISSGKNRALIYWIKVSGTKFTSDSCEVCPKGTFSKSEGSADCESCPINTFSDKEGSTSCTACDDDKYATLGSTTCLPRPICTKDDYYAYYTSCSNGKRELKFDWKYPKYCYQGVELPANKVDQPCNQCPKGQFRKDDVCQQCNGPFQYYDGMYKDCRTCYEGYAAIKYKRYDSAFLNEIGSKLPEEWSNKCLGECDKENNGWRVVSNAETGEAYLDAAGGGYGDETLLSIPFELYTDGNIEVDYEIVTEAEKLDTSMFLIFINGTLQTEVTKSTSVGKAKFKSKYYPPGSYLLSLAFDKYDSVQKQSTVKVTSIVIEGEKSGAADSCIECREGFYCPQKVDQFIPCPPGQYSNVKSEVCMGCYNGYFNDKWAQQRCRICGTGTASGGMGALECINTCSYQIPGTEIIYNLTELQSALNDPQFEGLRLAQSDLRIFFSLCNRFDTAQVPYCKKESRPAVNELKKLEKTSKNIRKGYTTYSCIEQGTEENRRLLAGDMGNVIFYSEASDPSKRAEGLTVSLSTDYKCPDNSGIYKTEIELKCNPKAGIGKPVFKSVERVGSGKRFDEICTANVLWESSFACPVCTIYDYEVVLGACEDGKRKRKNFLKPDSKCVPHSTLGLQLLPEVVEDCPICSPLDYHFVDTKCIAGKSTRKFVWKEPKNCTGGVNLPHDEELPCEEVEVGFTTALSGFIVIGSIFLCLVAVIGVCYAKNRKLNSQYELLSGREGGQHVNEFELRPTNVEVYDQNDSEDENLDIDIGFHSNNNSIAINPFSDSDEDKV
ncbi:hypothetical protein ABK040_001500 [Willaertia magna]